MTDRRKVFLLYVGAAAIGAALACLWVNYVLESMR